MAQSINTFSILFFLAPLLLSFYFMKKLKIPLIKKSSISIGRMIGQLALVGLYLQYIFNINNPFLNIAYLIFMTSIAVWTVTSDLKVKEIKIYAIVFVALLIPLTLNLLMLSNLILTLENHLDAVYLIPITGMLLGNSLNGVVVALGDFIKNLRKNEDEYIFSLALGASKKEAIRPYISDAVALALKPNIATMASIGVVSLPGMMTGQILGGTIPILAIKYQIVIMLSIYLSRFFSTYILLDLLSRFYFDKYSMFNKKF